MLLKATDSQEKETAYWNLIETLWQGSLYEECSVYCDLALSDSQIVKSSVFSSNVLRIMGNLKYMEGDYTKALELYLTSLSYAEEANDSILTANVLNNIGSIYNVLDELDEALSCFTRSAKLREQADDSANLMHTYSNIGNVFAKKAMKNENKKQNYQEIALENYFKGLELAKISPNYRIKASSFLNNIGSLYLEMNNPDEAIQYFQQSEHFAEEAQNNKSLFHALSGISEYYQFKKDYDSALKYAMRAMDCAKAINAKDKLKDLALDIANIYANLNDFQNAYSYQIVYTELLKNIFNDEMKNRITDLQTKYEVETKAKEAEIYRLKNIELVKANTEIEQQRAELEKLNSAKNEFMGMVVHDLRNPISCVLGLCDLYELKIDDSMFEPENMMRNLHIIKVAGERMNSMVSQLLDIAAIETGKIELNITKQKFESMILERQFYYMKLAERKEISLKIDYNNLNYELVFDKDRILDVLDNLISNAIKFTHPGGSVFLNFDIEQNKFITKVSDTGQGFTREELDKLFVSFQKYSARPTSGESSTGFGLLIVKKIIDLHNGEIFVQSQKNVGTTFSFSLALAD